MGDPRELRCLPISLVNELRCRNCDGFLSCGPVRVVNDLGSSCGRCVQFSGKQYHNQAYEGLANYFQFPCNNWSTRCPVSLGWNESLQHEEHCSYTGCLSFFCAHPGACCNGSRQIQDVQETNVSLVPLSDQAIKKYLCLSCEKPLSCAPVYVTSEGYDVCHRCAGRRDVNNSLKNVAYETLARLFVFPCAFKSKGCPARLRFGAEAFQHEQNCKYGITRLSTRADGKYKGVIKTHTGHYFGTITPHQPAFAPPPGGATGFDVNREIVKSIQKKQHKQRGAIDGNFYWEEGSETSSDGRITPGSDPNILNARDLDKQFQKPYPPPPPMQGDYYNPGFQPDYYGNREYRDGPPLQYSSSNAVSYDRRPIQSPPVSQSFNHGRPQRPLPRRVSSKKEKPAYLDELVNRHRVQRNPSNTPNPYNECNNLSDLREAHTKLGVPAGVYS